MGIRAVKGAATAAILLFLALSPGWLVENAMENPWLAFWKKPAPLWHGRLELWHVAEYRTYQGSVTDFLQQRADAYWKKVDRGVHIDVVGLTLKKYNDRIARGLTPDAYSFFPGLVYAEQLQAMDVSLPPLSEGLAPAAVLERIYAVPVLYSGYFLVANVPLLSAANLSLPGKGERVDPALLEAALNLPGKVPGLHMPEILAARAGLTGTPATLEQFQRGEVALAVLDARALGDILRGGDGNLLVEAVPYPAYTEQTVYLGAGKNASPEQVTALAGFIEYLLTEDQQQKLTGLGALPAAALETPPVYGEKLLKSLYEAYVPVTVPEPFSCQRHGEALLKDARAALSGDPAASASFFRRMAVVEKGGVW